MADEIPSLRSPWAAVRAQNPDAILVRVIDRERRLQFWISIPRTEKNLSNGAAMHDGATVLLPGRLADEMRDGLIAEFDALWLNQEKQCPSTSPTTGANA